MEEPDPQRPDTTMSVAEIRRIQRRDARLGYYVMVGFAGCLGQILAMKVWPDSFFMRLLSGITASALFIYFTANSYHGKETLMPEDEELERESIKKMSASTQGSSTAVPALDDPS
jgi:hypothetical protein